MPALTQLLAPLLGLIALWLLGALTLSLIGARKITGVERLVADLTTGIVILAAIGMTTLALGLHLSPLPIYLLLIALTLTAIWRRSQVPVSIRLPEDPRAKVLLTIAGLLILAFTISASQDRLIWDGWAFWTLKATILFHENYLPTPILDLAGPYPYAHPEYPLAVPLLDWWLYRHAGTPNPSIASLAGVLWFTTLPALTWAALYPRLGELTAALATLGVTTFWPLAYYATGGYADVVISLALLGTILEITRIHGGNDDPASPYRLALYLTLAALSKNEGLALAALSGAVILAGRLIRTRQAALTIGLPLLTAAPWFIYTRSLGLTPQHLTGAGPAPLELIARIPTVLTALTRLLSTRAWIPVAPLIFLGLSTAIRRRRLSFPAGWSILAGYSATILVVYLMTPLELEWLLSTTIDRMAGHLIPAALTLSLIEISEAGNAPTDPSASRAHPQSVASSNLAGSQPP